MEGIAELYRGPDVRSLPGYSPRHMKASRRIVAAGAFAGLGVLAWLSGLVPMGRPLEQQSTREVFAVAARDSWSEQWTASEATEVLLHRPIGELVDGAQLYTHSGSAGERRGAVKVVGTLALHSRDDPQRRSTFLNMLWETIDDADEVVRATAAFTLAFVGVDESMDRHRLAEKVVALLRSADPEARRCALLASLQVGDEFDEATVHRLCDQLGTETDPGLCYLLAANLGKVMVARSRAVDALIPGLASEYDAVRAAAAGSLGELGAVARVGRPELRELADDSAQPVDVRRAAVQALAQMAVAGQDAEQDLRLLLDCRHLFVDLDRTAWFGLLGKVGALVPDSEAGRAARAILEGEMTAEEGEFEAVAASSLVCIAVAARDVELARRSGAVVGSMFDWLENDLAVHPFGLGVVEAMVALSRWPEMEVDATRIRSYLERVGCRHAFERRWRDRQLALLRQ
ncbi:MAG: HEAT repeat domain-containing protein [Planctomycetes bacterium]|nr:HEAT repeat domain-containing protein [Planctomycetota bacterium]